MLNMYKYNFSGTPKSNALAAGLVSAGTVPRLSCVQWCNDDSADSCRCGFNGQQKHDEVRGAGNTLDFKTIETVDYKSYKK
jgi:hypothetical protein